MHRGPRFALLLLITLNGSFHPSYAQSSGAAKPALPAGSPYSSEVSGSIPPELARKDSEIRAALTDQPDSAGLLYGLALIQREEGKPRDSLDTYTRAARFRRPTPQELRSVALDYVLLRDFDDAIHWLEMAVQMDPKDPDILYSLGRCYYSKDRYADAGKLYERVLTIQPHNLKAEENLGLVYDASNDPVKAEQALRSAADWAGPNSTDEWPFLDLGSFLLDHNRAKEAIDPLRAALRITPSCAACHEKLGRALVATNDSAVGIAELEQATKLDPKNPKTHYELGRALRQAGQLEKARQELSISQKLYSTHSQQ
ncbi:MAG TPA: tetratricopeptide repeat protein [Terracidiphilus sp.]|nr:tetratricopeptide repeat protein [Terracidiphilus sp.]